MRDLGLAIVILTPRVEVLFGRFPHSWGDMVAPKICSSMALSHSALEMNRTVNHMFVSCYDQKEAMWELSLVEWRRTSCCGGGVHITLSTFVFFNTQLVKQLHLYCLNTFLQSRALSVEFPEMMSEVIAAQLPKILAGMVKPLLFHKKWTVSPPPPLFHL